MLFLVKTLIYSSRKGNGGTITHVHLLLYIFLCIRKCQIKVRVGTYALPGRKRETERQRERERVRERKTLANNVLNKRSREKLKRQKLLSRKDEIKYILYKI